MRNHRHVAGIVPISGQPLDFDQPFDDCLMPIAPNYTLVEAAVVACACASCDTIWLVCDDDVQPLVRERFGEFVADPYTLNLKYKVNLGWTRERMIPLYFVPLRAKDYRTKRSLGWSVIWGAEVANYAALKISKWVRPTSYLTVFPYGLFDPGVMYQYRHDLRKLQRVYFTIHDETVKSGLHLPFTFLQDDLAIIRESFDSRSTGAYEQGRRLGANERHSGRFFGLDETFEPAIIDDESKLVELYWYHEVSSWDGYRQHLASEQSLERPDSIIKFRDRNPIFGCAGEHGSE